MSSSVKYKVVGIRDRVQVSIVFLFPLGHSDLRSYKLWVVDNLLLDHVGLPQDVIVAV